MNVLEFSLYAARIVRCLSHWACWMVNHAYNHGGYQLIGIYMDVITILGHFWPDEDPTGIETISVEMNFVVWSQCQVLHSIDAFQIRRFLIYHCINLNKCSELKLRCCIHCLFVSEVCPICLCFIIIYNPIICLNHLNKTNTWVMWLLDKTPLFAGAQTRHGLKVV